MGLAERITGRAAELVASHRSICIKAERLDGHAIIAATMPVTCSVR